MAVLTFEHPLNELTRVNLRLEFLFKKITDNINHNEYWAIRSTIESIVQISHILDRPDLKSKYAKAIQVEINYLENLAAQPGIDSIKLETMIDELRTLFQAHNQTGIKLGQPIRNNQFLNTIRQHLLCPGGEAEFELPAYHCWLNTNASKINTYLNELFHELATVKQTVDTLLMLIRSKRKQKKLIAENGLHQEILDGNDNTQLVRIMIDNQNTYPVISAGKHRINIRFYDANNLKSEEQLLEDISFSLSCCG